MASGNISWYDPVMDNQFSSKQVSEETGLSVHTLRYYEQEGLIDGIQRDENGYRVYSASDVVWFHVIKYFRRIGLPVREIKQFNIPKDGKGSSAAARREFMENYREKVLEQMKELQESLNKIDDKIAFFRKMEQSEIQVTEADRLQFASKLYNAESNR
ncbi:MerR family transcriptional regulator [Saccharibacillus sp. CPCC 101409]|uniref:MerR family transcriptional regulator n=1 Tax=Saccharibacillus sp. CPCC 101409 TaxID=3058041 RepID=UPI002673CC6B|nr:MerR family transcriptional regulator [Saccharibacillus sp. CPCC 101409]MDO3412344.1 MerR family transcriptional regulator [Saccharibacillus sp. CPCC 101409]